MIRNFLLFSSILLFAAPAPSQDETDAVPGDAIVGVDVRLRAASKVQVAGKTAILTLTVTANQDASVPAVLLAGMDMTATIDGAAAKKWQVPVRGNVRLAAGTRIERTLTLDMSGIHTPPIDPKQVEPKLAQLTFTWRNLPGATVACKIAPDGSKIDMKALDLAKTRVLLLTSHGEMLVKFRPDKAPNTVANFIKLSKEGFYDGTQFHRVVKNFMIQGGCPNTKEGASGIPGTGNPGYALKAEFNDIRHVRGVLSMARSADPDSAGSQFFICHGEASALDNGYTAFGELESGLGILDQIANVRVQPNPQREVSSPVAPVHLYAAIVLPVYK